MSNKSWGKHYDCKGKPYTSTLEIYKQFLIQGNLVRFIFAHKSVNLHVA